MKVSEQIKEYKELNGMLTKVRRIKFDAECADNFELMNDSEVLLKKIKDKISNDFDHVNIEYVVGYLWKWETVVKIGKSYFIDGEKMTQKNGYRKIKEIEEITERMKERMIADSYAI